MYLIINDNKRYYLFHFRKLHIYVIIIEIVKHLYI
jgi:hypothetical protein